MPELPEAETVRRALEGALCGKKITQVEIFSPAMRTPLAPLSAAGLEGLTFTGIRRRGRYLLADLSDGRALMMHLGMSGVVRVESSAVPRRKHEHVFIHLDDGNIFRFECTRRFSILEVHTLNERKLPEQLEKLGAEPLSEEFSGKTFFAACSKRNSPVKNLLMDNSIVTGIGNIYAAETLFAAGVSPCRSGKELSLRECERIVRFAREILTAAIEAGGTTISDFRHVDGSEGEFVRNLQIYGKENQPCPRCGKIIQSVRIGGRASCFCPGCQK